MFCAIMNNCAVNERLIKGVIAPAAIIFVTISNGDILSVVIYCVIVIFVVDFLAEAMPVGTRVRAF
jgi:hypothetical protein